MMRLPLQSRVSESERTQVFRELLQCESDFHHPRPECTQAAIERMIAAGFVEIGASGRRYGRDQAVAMLLERWRLPDREAPRIADAEVLPLGEACWALIHAGAQENGIVRRTTIWRREPEGWVALFHQGTRVAG